MNSDFNPFPITSYTGPEYFCDREEETRHLVSNFKSGISTTLVSIRRLGKTGLIRHVCHNLNREYTTIYLDIHATENMTGFLNALVTAVVSAIPEKSRTGKHIWDFIKSLRPVFSFDSLSGSPLVTLDLKQEQAERNTEAMLRLLENHPKRILIAIDEFQQILNYPEKTTDAWLRSIFQHLKNVSFIFSGSRQHIMADLFNNPSRPFYRSTGILKLNKIDKKAYSDFIIKKFKAGKRQIPQQLTEEILDWTECYTYYVQLLCKRLYSSGTKKIDKKLWQDEAYKMLKEQEIVFFNYRDLLTKGQWALLKAIAAEDVLYSPTSQVFISKNNLGSSASVLRSLDSLIEKEMVYFDYSKEGEKYYKVYDLLLKRWMQHLMGK
jgi:uncharacterized protein